MKRMILTSSICLILPTVVMGNALLPMPTIDMQLLMDGVFEDSFKGLEPITDLKEEYLYIPDPGGDVNKAQFSRFHSGEKVYVGVDGANFRSLEDKEMIIAKLPLAAKATIVSVVGEPTVEAKRRNVWYHVRLVDGEEGLIFGAVLTPYAGMFMGNYASDNDIDDNGNFIGQKWTVTFAPDGKPRLRVEAAKMSKDVVSFDLTPTEEYRGGILTARTQVYDSNGYEYSEQIDVGICPSAEMKETRCHRAIVRAGSDNTFSQVTPVDLWKYIPSGELSPSCSTADTLDFQRSEAIERQFQLDLGTMDFYSASMIDCYAIGTVNGGKYSRKKLLSCTRTVDDKSGIDRESVGVGRYIQDKDSLVYLPCVSNEWDATLVSNRMAENKMKNDVDASITTIAGLSIPEELPVAKGKLFYVAHLAPMKAEGELLFTDETVGPVYSSDGEILAVQPDKSTLKYVWSPTEQRDPVLFGQSYLQYGFGCSDLPFKHNLAPDVSKDDVETVMILPSGIEISKLKDPNHKVNLRNLEIVKTEQSSTDFLATNPWVFVEDPWGRMIQLMRKELQPPAMCEPILYVYADEPTQVSISPVEPLYFFKTIPHGPEGWEGVAHADGSVTVDGRRWPELFWEGRSFMFDLPEENVVVAEEDIEIYLRKMLQAQGLIDKEIAAFLEAWMPDLQDRGSFRMAFHSMESIEDVAPLEIIPAPETLIRVLLDAAPTDEKPNWDGSVPRFELPERGAITVVEWGGILRD